MPVQTCKTKGKPGKRYGKTGKCYTGKQAKARASRQGRAIKANQGKR